MRIRTSSVSIIGSAVLAAVTVYFSSVAMAQGVAVPTQVKVLARSSTGQQVTNIDVLADLQRAPEETRQVILSQPASLQQIANNLLIRRILAAEAERDEATKNPLVAANIAIGRDRVLSEARLAKIDQQNEPSAAAIDAYARNVYKANSDKFERPAETRASHILIENKEGAQQQAKDILAKLRAGAKFEDLAKEFSKDPGSAARGGDLGFFGAGKMVRPFEDAVSKLAKPGDLSEPIETQFGFHIIRLEERREKGVRPYEEVRELLLNDARTAILNEGRVSKSMSMQKDITFDTSAIEAMVPSAKK